MLRALPRPLIGLAAVALLALGCPQPGLPATAAGTRTFMGSASVPERFVFAPTGSMVAAHHRDAGLLLNDGRFISTGGEAELYDPATGAWSPAGSLSGGLLGHAAALLSDGRVLVVGGGGNPSVYDPVTNTWSATGPLLGPSDRPGGRATLLNDGRVLFTGGVPHFEEVLFAQLYDPATNTWSPTGDMSRIRSCHTATLLNDGRVLVAGGSDATAELYDPATNIWSPTGSMSAERTFHTATLLGDGRVLVAGGSAPGAHVNSRTESAELYDPATGAWSPTGSLIAARSGQTATLLSDGTVLVTGGPGPSVEQYDPATGAWSPAGTLAEQRIWHTAAQLHDGKVIVVGGDDRQYQTLTSVELGALAPANAFAGILTLPSGWITSPALSVQFHGSTSGDALEAGTARADGGSLGEWVKATPGVPASTTVQLGLEGADRPIELFLRDSNGQVALVVTGTLDIDWTSPSTWMTPLPLVSTTRIELSWSAYDLLSGVGSYDLQAQEGSGPWHDVLRNTASTSATFQGRVGRSYAFRVRARDLAGNVKAWHEEPDATTMVVVAARDWNPVYLPLVRRDAR